ncbi:alcohol dehydrogenase [Cupriavidus basilensis]|nr:alcohol dehydrogenase [Cupriavidus basilensis]
MKSYDIVEWGKPLQTVLRERPRPIGAQVLVKVEACGVCHSDVHIWEGYLDMGGGKKVSFEDVGVKLPFTLGHEIVGVVEEAGPEAAVPVGMRCVVYPWIGCGTCRHCARGNELDCAANVGLGTRKAGGYSDYVVVPHDRYVIDYGSIDPYVAATSACSGLTAYSALRKLPEYQADDTVLLIGAGGLGLAALGLASVLTPAKILVADIDDPKLSIAAAHGAAGTINTAQQNSIGRLREMVGEGVRGVIDFVGSPETLSFAIQSVGKGGTIIVVGLFGGELPLSTALLPMRNLTLRGSYVGSLQEMNALIDLLKRRNVLSVPLHKRPVGTINEMLHDLKAGRINGRAIAVMDHA